MSKMMMGQIDHAKARVKELKLAKYGDKPLPPKLKGSSDVILAIRENDISITAPTLRRAFDAYVDEEVSPGVKKESGSYKNDFKTRYTLAEKAPSSIEAALASIIYEKVNAAECARWEAETELYDTRQEAINIAATNCEDAIVLGDQHAALVALQEFANFEV